MQNKLDLEALRQMQRLGLEAKISMSVLRIREWIDEYGSDGVYISFSGGKDSTVLLHLIRTQFPYYDIPAVFIDTGLEYPEIKEFVKTVENVTVVRPEMSFRQVIKKYGYPFFSKTIAHNVSVARRNPNGNVKKIFLTRIKRVLMQCTNGLLCLTKTRRLYRKSVAML